MRTATDAIDITTFSSAVGVLSVTGGAYPFAFRIVTTAGTVTVKTAKAGSSRTLTVAEGELVELAISEITSVTDVTRIRLYW